MSGMMQRYISKELTHFIGRGQTPESQYKLLIKIINEGWLTHAPHNARESGNLVVRGGVKISKNEMYAPQMVCFCDIPVDDLRLHTEKYSSFGIAFDKNFIVEKGGAPVHYLPIKSKVKALIDLTMEQQGEFAKPEGAEHLYQYIDKGEYFDKVVPKYHKLFQILNKLIFEEMDARHHKLKRVLGDSIWDYPRDSDNYPILDFPRNALEKVQKNGEGGSLRDAMWFTQQLNQFQRLLDFHWFSYLKFFNHNYADDHPENYYFEREWRVVGNINFNLENVKRVLIPEKYARKFREDCHDYYSQLTFIE